MHVFWLKLELQKHAQREPELNSGPSYSKANLEILKRHREHHCVMIQNASVKTANQFMIKYPILTRVSNRIGTIGWTLWVGRDDGGCSGRHRLHSWGDWVDWKSGGGWAGCSWFNGCDLTSLLSLSVRSRPLAVPSFGSWKNKRRKM